jgi:phosphatidylserine decarboxylase
MLIHIPIGILITLIMLLPLAWKWQLGVFRIGALVVLMGLVAGLLVTLLGRWVSIALVLQIALTWLIAVAGVFAFLAYRFYRDPNRTVPDLSGVIVSPADGKVVYIREARDGMLPVSTKHGQDYPLRELTKMPFYTEQALVIGISMNFMDVHVNRSPIAGRVSFQCHFPGSFGSLRLPEMVFENERATTVFEREELQVAVVQIASRLVRQIVSFVEEGRSMALGERFGVIRFGSQVDMVVPSLDSLDVLVKPGDTVKAGLSIIARYATIDQQVPESEGRQRDVATKEH